MSTYTIPYVVEKRGNAERTMDVYSRLLSERIAQDSLRDRWYTAEQAVEYGFVDRVVQGSEELYGGTARPMTGLRVPA